MFFFNFGIQCQTCVLGISLFHWSSLGLSTPCSHIPGSAGGKKCRLSQTIIILHRLNKETVKLYIVMRDSVSNGIKCQADIDCLWIFDSSIPTTYGQLTGRNVV